MKQVLFATSNPSKVKRFKEGLAKVGIEVLSLKDLNIDLEVEENGNCAIENALSKARTIYAKTHMPTIGMDDTLYLENVKDYNGTKGLIMEVHDKDVNLLKSIADNIVNQTGECFVFFANIKENGSINFLARSTNRVNAGLIVKDAAVSSEGNGGGSPTFAQGGGKNTEALEKIYAHIEKVLNNE